MADPRLSTHQQFDLMRCKLCNNIYDDPRLLQCLHSFCLACLDKQVAHMVSPSDDDIPCPLCNEMTRLPPTGGTGMLMRNTLIDRYILQAQRDQTKRVAGREVLEMTKQALTEAELESPAVIANLQHIADTAGNVIADDIAEQSKIHNFETLKMRQSLQAKTTLLQENALEIIYSIDKVNHGIEDWAEKKNQLREKIKQRSLELQDSIRGIERKLISKLEDRDIEAEIKNEAFSVKTKLHKTLRGSLTMVDFLKLLTEHGDQSELEMFTAFVKEREETLLTAQIPMKQNSYTFDSPRDNIDGVLQITFGTFSEITEETVAWDPTQKTECPRHENSHDSSPGSDIESHLSHRPDDVRTEPYLMTRYMEINENGQLVEKENDDTEYGSRYAKRFDPNQSLKNQRRPLKSMSFDAGMSGSGYNPNPNLPDREHNTHPASDDKANSHHTPSEYQMLNENTDVTVDSNTCTTSHAVSSALQSLAPTSDHVQYPGQRSWSRRVSAPSSMIINSLSQRRLSALSILERANINTEGLHMMSDVESGMNDARLEWLRENIRRKAQHERRTSVDEGV